jgi:adenine-specific DNA-methyltransferase
MKRIKEKAEIIADLEKRVADKILEKSNFDLLKKLVENADSITEAIQIAELGTTYKRTGFHFDKRLERQTDTISYFKKNKKLSFTTEESPVTHKLIIGDNYPALLNLLVEYKGKVDVIYIDPPYGKDNMGEFADTNYDNAITRDNLLSMLYPRLWIAKRLLSDNGVIFCSIDDRNQAYVKCLFDEIFEEKNSVAVFPWRKRTAKSDVPFGVSQDHEWILCYAKSQNFKARTNGKERKYYETPDFPNRPWRMHDLTTQRSAEERPNSNYTMINPKNGKKYPVNPNRVWGVTKDTFQKYYDEGKIIFPGDYDFLNVSKPVFRYFKDDDMKKADFGLIAVSTNLPADVGMSKDGTQEMNLLFGSNTPFKFPKPISLIKFLLKISTNGDGVVLDFFAGSGTTGQAVLELNAEYQEKSLQFILVTNNDVTDLNPNGIAYDATSKRLKRVMTGKCYDGSKDFDWIKENEPLGGNLLVCDIAEVPNFETTPGKTPFDVIDETLYGCEKFKTVKEKTEWVCDNFEVTQKRLGKK